MVVEVVPGVLLVGAVSEVGVPPVFLRATSRPVFDHGGDTVWAELLSLEPEDVGCRHCGRQLCILSKRAVDTRPSWLGGQIGHRMEGDADADRTEFRSGDCGELEDEKGIVGGGEAYRLRPLRPVATEHVGAKEVLDAVPWIGRDGDRDAETILLGDPLKVVMPLGQISCFRNTIQIECAKLLVDQIVVGRAEKEGGR